MGRLLKFGSILIGMNMMKKAPQGDRVATLIGALLVIAPILYELAPKFKTLYHRLTNPAPKREKKKSTPGSTSGKAMAVINDESLSRTTVTFKPGQLGCGFTEDGVVSIVLEGSQADEAGVKVGWHCLDVGGKKPESIIHTQELIKKYRGGFEDYTATFLTEADVVQANATLLAQWKEEEEKLREQKEKEGENEVAETDGQLVSEKEGQSEDTATEQDGLRRRKGEEEEAETAN